MEEDSKNDIIPKFTFEERHRLLGFFSILLAVDKQLHPEHYQPKQKKTDESNTIGEGIG